jgi:hypothetical protein
MTAVCAVRDRWLSDQGQEHSETDRGLAHLRNQLMRHSDRFRWIDGTHPVRPVRDLLGYRVAEYYLLTDEGLRELCGEHDMRAMLSALKVGGWLWHDMGRLTRKSPKIEEFGKSRPNLYWIDIKLLGEQDENTEEDRVVSGETVGPEPLSETDDIPF